jgi:poly(3-hydroxybutyrate) depolymerase
MRVGQALARVAVAVVPMVALLVGCVPAGKDVTLVVDGETAILHHQPSKTPRPLVVVLHGLGGNARDMQKVTGMSAFADQNGFSVVYAEAHRVVPRPVPVPAPGDAGTLVGSVRVLQSTRAVAARSVNEMHLGATGSTRAWNAGAACCGGAWGDDVTYLRHVVDRAARSVPVDRRRVYVVGLSNGGMMATRAVCEAPDVFAAAGSVAGPYLGTSCRRPIWHQVHGGNDPIVPSAGGVPPGSAYLKIERNWCRCSFPSSLTEPRRFRGWVGVTFRPAGTHSWPTLSNPSWRLDGNALLWQSVRGFRL